MAEVITGEAVVLEVPCARFPSRLLALGIDLLIQIVLLILMFLLAGMTAAAAGLDPALAGALILTLTVAIIVGYPVIWETLSRGASPGKFAMGLRVVSDDGGPERFRQALVRALAAVVEIWALVGFPALVCSVLSARGKRLGDVFAGTFVIQQRLPGRPRLARQSAVPPALAQWAAGAEISALPEQTAETARRYLARMPELTPAARMELAARIAATVQAHVSPPPPPGTPAPEFLAAVVAERRNREHARLMAAYSTPSPSPPPGGTPPQRTGTSPQPTQTSPQPSNPGGFAPPA